MIVPQSTCLIPLNQNLKLLQAIEVWSTDGDEKGNRKIGNLVPMHKPHFDQCKASGAFQKDAEGKPVYFTRDSSGIEFHPACDQDYWFEPIFRRPIPLKAGQVTESGALKASQ